MREQMEQTIRDCIERQEEDCSKCEEFLSECQQETDCPPELISDFESCISAQKQLKTRCEEVLSKMVEEKEVTE